MLVSRQIFNYRLIIGTLIITFFVIGSYSIIKYQKLKDHQSFVEQETSLVQNELKEMIRSYDEIQIVKKTTDLELSRIKAALSQALDSVRLFSEDASIMAISENEIVVLEDEIVVLEQKKLRLLGKANLIKNQNTSLEAEIIFLSNQVVQNQKQYRNLGGESSFLSKTVRNTQPVSAVNIRAIALKVISPKDDAITKSIAELDHIEVCLTLLSNEYTSKGNKNIFVQIYGPDKQLVVEKIRPTFRNVDINYSGMTVVNNDSDRMDICTKININSKELFTKGTYSVVVYSDQLIIGKSELELN